MSKPTRSRPGTGASAAILPLAGAIVLPFVPRAPQRQHFTMRDRMTVTSWQQELPLFGYDRLVIHSRVPGDPPELGDLLMAYRIGEPWAAWGFARQGDAILAWSCATGADIGRFADFEEAVTRVLSPAGALPAVQVPSASGGGAPIRLFRS